MNVVYRSARVDDYEGIYYVSCYSWSETYRGYMPDDYLDERINNFKEKSLKTKAFLEKLAEEGQLDNYLVCEVDSKIVGICNYLKGDNKKYSDSGLLGALYVLKQYQKLGIGKELFARAVEGLIDMGFNSMYLECLTGNKAIGFYEKYGGNIIENIDYPISDFTVKADVVFYDNLEKVKKLVRSK